MTRRERAIQNFYDGYNCTQSVVLAFEELLPFDSDTILKMVSPFGGGMGRLREVCGSVSGMFFVLGIVCGYSEPKDTEAKKDLYALVQNLAKEFENTNGSIVCRELLGLVEKRQDPTPEERSAEYYKKRPCPELIGNAAQILDDFLKQEGVIQE